MSDGVSRVSHAILAGRAMSVVVDWGQGRPRIAHLGQPLDEWNPDVVSRPVPPASVEIDPLVAVVTEEGDGFAGRPGVAGSRSDGSGWSPRFSLAADPTMEPRSVSFSLGDDIAGLELDLTVSIDDADAVIVGCALTNRGDTDYRLDRFALSIEVPAHLREVQTFTGRWCREFEPQRVPLAGTIAVENRRGRTSHDRMPALFIGEPAFGEQHGEVLGAQLAWSGNHELGVTALSDGRTQLHVGELFLPGEVVLEPGDRHEAAAVVLAWSAAGLTAASQVFHRHVRGSRPRPLGPRPVTLNTWEAVYFDHDADRLLALVDVAAEVGVERFVLDDGWFGDRRDDTAGLGDWTVSPDAWPDGLAGLVDRVLAAGMTFGLWFEPESVNPDSDLYRSHPDWALGGEGHDPVLARNQLVLDFGRSDVRDHIVEVVGRVLADHEISFVKWDMNRDFWQATSGRRPGVRAHVLGLYSVIDRLRVDHPGVEFESCASGGGRADLGILALTDRIWTSDCNDAVDRQRIQRGFSMLFPPEVMGAHIGGPRAHTTDRSQRLDFRAATALFGHLGVEWNLLDASERDRERLAAHIATHKRLRPLLHDGDVTRVDHPDSHVLVHGVVAADRSRAVFALVRTDTALTSVGAPLRVAGVDPHRTYRVEVVEGFAPRSLAPAGPAWMPSTTVTGAQLMANGLQPPVMSSESALIVELEAT